MAPTYFIQSGLVETSLVCRFYSLHTDPIWSINENQEPLDSCFVLIWDTSLMLSAVTGGIGWT